MFVDDLQRLLESLAKRVRALETLEIRLYVGVRDGPRSGMAQHTADDEHKVYTFQQANALNEPFVSFWTEDDGDPQSAEASIGYGGYPQLFMETHPSFDRKITALHYIMAVPGDWDTAPKIVREALDELAARLRAAGH